jgi:hypothetical protein
MLEIIPDEFDRLKKLADALQAIILRLHRDHDFIGGDKAVHGEQTQARREVDQNIIVLVPQAIDEFPQKIFSFGNIHELNERSCEMRRAGNVVIIIELATPR